MQLQTRALAVTGFGAEVLGADLADIDARMADAIQDGLVQHGLLLFRRQSLDDNEILRVAKSFGVVVELAAKKYHAPGFTQVNYVSNLHDDAQRLIGGLTTADQDEGVWHSDQNFRAHPATISTLFCVHNPAQGGGTSFASTVLGYASLPEHLKARIQGLRGRYLPGKVHEIEKIEVHHPVVLVNPVTGIHALYVAGNTLGFVGLAAEQGEALKRELLDCLLRVEHRYSHNWRMGDMLIYDNAQLVHRRESFRGLRWLKSTRSFASAARFAVPD